MVGRIQMKLGTQVGLSPGHIVLDGDPGPTPPKGHNPPIFRPCVLCPNSWMDQDATGMEVGLSPGHIVLDGNPAPLPKKGGTAPQFSAHDYCAQTTEWIKMPLAMEVGLGPGHIVLDRDTAPPPPKRGHSLPQFSAHD